MDKLPVLYSNLVNNAYIISMSNVVAVCGSFL